MSGQDTAALIARVEGLLEQLESLGDSPARDMGLGALEAVLDLYGEGLARVLDQVGEAGAGALAQDELVEHLLLLHGLHPVPVERRVRDALAGVRPYLESHGGDVELVGVQDGVARLRLQGSCEGCPASAMTLKLAIEDAIFKAAPDVSAVEAVGLEAPAPPPLLQIELAGPGRAEPIALPMAAAAPPEAAWAAAGSLPQLANGGTLLKQVGGEPLLFLRVDGTPYAYRPRCPACEASMEGAELAITEMTVAAITCPSCGSRYDARRAGRCLDHARLQLEPVPLLEDGSGLVRVAVQAAGVI